MPTCVFWFLIGTVVGSVFGYILAALLSANGDEKE